MCIDGFSHLSDNVVINSDKYSQAVYISFSKGPIQSENFFCLHNFTHENRVFYLFYICRCFAHTCGANQYPCSNTGACIHMSKVCDGTRDCQLGNDEVGISSNCWSALYWLILVVVSFYRQKLSMKSSDHLILHDDFQFPAWYRNDRFRATSNSLSGKNMLPAIPQYNSTAAFTCNTYFKMLCDGL